MSTEKPNSEINPDNEEALDNEEVNGNTEIVEKQEINKIKLDKHHIFILLIMFLLNFVFHWKLIFTGLSDGITILITFPREFPLLGQFLLTPESNISEIFSNSGALHILISIFSLILYLVSISFCGAGFLAILDPISPNSFNQFLKAGWLNLPKMLGLNTFLYIISSGGTLIFSAIYPFLGLVFLIIWGYCTYLLPFILIWEDLSISETLNKNRIIIKSNHYFKVTLAFVLILGLASLLIQFFVIEPFFSIIAFFIAPVGGYLIVLGVKFSYFKTIQPILADLNSSSVNHLNSA